MADISKITLPNSTQYDIKDNWARNNMATKVTSGATDDIVVLTSDGNIADSEKQIGNNYIEVNYVNQWITTDSSYWTRYVYTWDGSSEVGDEVYEDEYCTDRTGIIQSVGENSIMIHTTSGPTTVDFHYVLNSTISVGYTDIVPTEAGVVEYVGNGTLNITANSIAAGTFTANSSEDVDINIETGVVKIGNYYPHNALNIDYVLYTMSIYTHTYTIAEMNSTYPDASVGSYGIYGIAYRNVNFPLYRLCTVNDEGTWVDVSADEGFYTTNGSVIYKEGYFTTNSPIIGKASNSWGDSSTWLYDIRYVSQYDIYTLNNQKKQVMNDGGEYIYIESCELDLSDFEFEKGVIYLNVYTSAPYVWDDSKLIPILSGDVTFGGSIFSPTPTSTTLATELGTVNYITNNLATVATTGDYNDLINKIEISDIFTKQGSYKIDGIYISNTTASPGSYIAYSDSSTFSATGIKPYTAIYSSNGTLNRIIKSYDGMVGSLASYTAFNVLSNSEGTIYIFNGGGGAPDPTITEVESPAVTTDAINNYLTAVLKMVFNKINTSEQTTNKVTSISASSTDDEYPTAKCMYDIVGDIESILDNIIGE